MENVAKSVPSLVGRQFTVDYVVCMQMIQFRFQDSVAVLTS